MPQRALAMMLLLAACATTSPFDNIAAMQQRLDERGMGFGVTRVPGHDAVLFQIRFRTSEAEAGREVEVEPMEAARAAAPAGCDVASIEPQEDGLSFKVEYEC